MADDIVIMAVSDDHGLEGFKEAYDKAVKLYGHIDYVLHAGDVEYHGNKYYEDICKCPFIVVRGNNDYNDNPYDREFTIGGKRFLLTHGHKYGVYMGVSNLFYTAKEKNVDMVVFGHTHKAYYMEHEGVHILNPGSLTLPRGGREGTFAVAFVKNNKISVNHIVLS